MFSNHPRQFPIHRSRNNSKKLFTSRDDESVYVDNGPGQSPSLVKGPTLYRGDVCDFYEEIGDCRGFGLFNPCSHWSIKIDSEGGTVKYTNGLYYGSKSTFSTFGNLFQPQRNRWPGGKSPLNYFYSLHTKVRDFTPHVEGCKALMDSALASGFSGVQFLMELPDITKFPSTVRQLLSRVRDPKSLSLNDPLAYKFGIETAIRELRDAGNLAINLGNKVKALKRATPKRFWRTIKMKEHIKEFFPFCAYGGWSVDADLDIEYKICVEVTFKPPESLSEFGESLLRFADHWGLNPKLETIWDLTPWSWAINRIIPIGDAIDQIDKSIGLGDKFLSKYFSVKLLTSTCYQNLKCDMIHWGNPSWRRTCPRVGQSDGTFEFRSYRRSCPVWLQDLDEAGYLNHFGYDGLNAAERFMFYSLFS